jgi:translation initiation factor 1
MTADRLVYSTNPDENRRCAKCGQLIPQCVCRKDAKLGGQVTGVLRIEKAGRGGKTVTVIDKLPANEGFLANLARKLKNACGSGGTHRIDGPVGRIEIQGDKRERIRDVLEKEGIRCKG